MALEVELLVVGAGPAGLSAAEEAARLGVEVVVVDEHRAPGNALATLGTVSVRTAAGLRPAVELRNKLTSAATAAGAIILSQSLAWGLFDGLSVGLLTPGENVELRPLVLIVCAGTVDRPLPFAGWTLPTVLGAQEALRLGYLQDARSRGEVVVMSVGGLGVPVALALRGAGLTVSAVLEAGALTVQERDALVHVGIQPYNHAIVTKACGHEYLREVIVRTPGGTINLAGSTLVVASGRAPLTELCWLSGCEMLWEQRRGGYVPVRSAVLETSVERLFVAGGAGGVCGTQTAIAEGRLAGAAAAVRLGRGSTSALDTLIDDLHVALMNEAEMVTREMGVLWQVESTMMEEMLLDPEAIFCRCEGVPVIRLQDAVGGGAQTVGEVKRLTRIGMGECQGRTCRPLLSRGLARLCGGDVATSPPITFRPPVRPVPLSALLRGTE